MGPGSWAQTLRVPWVPCATGARDWVTCSKAAPARLASRNLLGPWDTVKAMHKCGQLSHLYTLVNKMKDVELCLLKLWFRGCFHLRLFMVTWPKIAGQGEISAWSATRVSIETV